MKCVLVADNRPIVREVVRLWVEMEGWRVLEAQNGQEARGLLLDRPVDAVVCDLEMTPGDGLWFYNQVSDLVEGKGIPFVFLAAPNSPERELAVLETGKPLFRKGVPGPGMPELVAYLRRQFDPGSFS